MEIYISDWLNLIFRWLHVIAGIAWIGASFYFNWLNNSLTAPTEEKKRHGIQGELWVIHGGGLYEVGKYGRGPETMPQTLHWFKWEAYSTWLTGMVLLVLIYYLGAEAYLIDSRVMQLQAVQAVPLGLIFIFGGWFLYDILCNSALANNKYFFSVLLFSICVGLVYALTHLFSARGAYIHTGVLLGTIMAGNVFRVIIPSQKVLVASLEKGEAPDPRLSRKAALRSLHNNYITLPVLFIMISNHYPLIYAYPYNWVVLSAIIAISVLARHYFNLRHQGVHKPAILIIAAIVTLLLAFVMAPGRVQVVSEPADTTLPSARQISRILYSHCTACHSAHPTDDTFSAAPAGVILDSLEQMQQWAQRIKARVMIYRDMPYLNKTGMTDAERLSVSRWISAGAPLE